MTYIVPSDEIRSRFASAMSAMYRSEVPQYGTMVDLVADVNAVALHQDPPQLFGGEAGTMRLHVERHGAIRLGTAHELSVMRRMLAVMDMYPVGYYDLSIAGVPVHSTAFRPVTQQALDTNPFRLFTSLLRLELIEDGDLRDIAGEILQSRKIFTVRALQLIEKFEAEGGLDRLDADEFVQESLETFRWHGVSTVTRADYERLRAAHPLIADVACFKGPHINHLTPRTLDIDEAQAEMPRRGISAKEVIEGPPRRKVPILLRQTSFKALEEDVRFANDGLADAAAGVHTARFGEIEQRGMALTRKGRALYDQLLHRARQAERYEVELVRVFDEFPDDLQELRRLDLGFFRFSLTTLGQGCRNTGLGDREIDELIAAGLVAAEPITYEDFLPISAAGIFQSNLGEYGQGAYEASEAKAAFQTALGAEVRDEIELYEQTQLASLNEVRRQLGHGDAS